MKVRIVFLFLFTSIQLLGCSCISQEQLNKNLISAITREKPEEVKKWLSKGADVNYQDYEGNTPLIQAAWEGKVNIIEILLENGADPDLQNNYGQTPLMIAVLGYKRCAITTLLEHKADINIQDENRNTAFMIATFIERPKVSTDIAKLLLNKKYNPDLNITNECGDTMLTLAVYRGWCYLVEAIVEYAKCNEPEKLDEIINHKNNKEESPLTISIEVFQNCISNYLIDNDADIEIENSYGNTPLLISVFKSNLTLIDRLICLGTNIDHQNKCGFTSLMFAATRGKEKIITKLLCSGADKCLKNNLNQTASDVACENKFSEMAKLIKNYC